MICFESDGFIAYSNEWDWIENKTMLIHTNQPLLTSFYTVKGSYFCRISDESALIRNFRATGVWGGKPIGRVRVKMLWKLSPVVRKLQSYPGLNFLNSPNSVVWTNRNGRKINEKWLVQQMKINMCNWGY